MKENPYNRIRREASEFISKCFGRKRTLMWRYPKDRLTEGWQVAELWERVSAAKQLGHTVELQATDAGLDVYYVRPNA